MSKMTEEKLTSTVAGLERLIASAYAKIPMDAFSTMDFSTMDATDTHGAAYGVNVTSFWSYSNLRTVNMLIPQIDKAMEKGTIGKAERDAMVGELLFIRAYMYFASVRALGGVPIVTEQLDSEYDGGENAGLYVPRSTEKETWDFVISELDKAIALLPETRTDGEFRANKWAALGLQSRVALYAASVSKYWNNAPIESSYQAVAKKLTYMEAGYADAYYQKCIEASEAIINSGKFSLYGGATTDRAKAAENLANLFLTKQNSEFIFGRSYETGVASASNGFDYANSPTQNCAQTTAWQRGRYSVTLDIVDAFDNYVSATDGARADGKIVTRTDGVENVYVSQISQNASSLKLTDPYKGYANPADPFALKDARFKAWVMYPGTAFRGTTIVIQGGVIAPDGKTTYYSNAEVVGKDGKKYYALGNQNEKEISGFYRLGFTNDGNWYSTGFGIRKFLEPSKALEYSVNPWYDIRYAEILLNYAEAVVESGKGDATKAAQYLNDIRHRAAFTDNIPLTIENVLHERRIELCFESDQNYTLHRRREYVKREAGVQHRKHALVPTLDLRGATPQYIFVRANTFQYDVDLLQAGLGISDSRNYYSGISNYTKNKIEPNPSQE